MIKKIVNAEKSGNISDVTNVSTLFSVDNFFGMVWICQNMIRPHCARLSSL